jgi:hypothetical protein
MIESDVGISQTRFSFPCRVAIKSWPHLVFWHFIIGGVPIETCVSHEHGDRRDSGEQPDSHPASCGAIDWRADRSTLSATYPGRFERLPQPATGVGTDAGRRLSRTSSRRSYSWWGISNSWIGSQPAANDPSTVSRPSQKPYERISCAGRNKRSQPRQSLSRGESISWVDNRHCHPAGGSNPAGGYSSAGGYNPIDPYDPDYCHSPFNIYKWATVYIHPAANRDPHCYPDAQRHINPNCDAGAFLTHGFACHRSNNGSTSVWET